MPPFKSSTFQPTASASSVEHGEMRPHWAVNRTQHGMPPLGLHFTLVPGCPAALGRSPRRSASSNVPSPIRRASKVSPTPLNGRQTPTSRQGAR
jgi:hypothetical protein